VTFTTQTKKIGSSNMARPTNKTPIQIAEELQLKADRARARAAVEMASDNPQIAKIADVLASFNKDIAGFSRKLTGPQSFENRLTGVRLRRNWIEAEQALVNAENTLAHDIKAYLAKEMQIAAGKVASGETLTDEYVQNVINGMPCDENVSVLADACHAAEMEWRKHTAEVKVKASAKGETVANDASAD